METESPSQGWGVTEEKGPVGAAAGESQAALRASGGARRKTEVPAESRPEGRQMLESDEQSILEGPGSNHFQM